MLSLVGCGGLGLLPHESKVASTNFQTYEQVEAAYTNVVPGSTRMSDLPKLGFDTATTPNVEILSYLGVIERFMPRNTMSFDHLAPPVQACIEAQDRCSAFVFHPEHVESRRMGSIFLDLFGFERETLDTGWSAEVVLLMQDGHVAYKLMSGRPRIEDRHDTVQPLGPLQDFGNTAFRAASRFF
ncbi:MAG: hypothetical protein KGJ78_09795 [Alphaproteobacteria bacterium]|nr:hypothetical protein [Alphaproteobacteria bacterium]